MSKTIRAILISLLTVLVGPAAHTAPALAQPVLATTSVTNTVTTVSNNVTVTVMTVTTTVVSAPVPGAVSANFVRAAGAAEGGARGSAAPEPVAHWQSTATLGASMTKGNADSVLLTVALNCQKKTPRNEYSLGADAAYGEQSSVQSADRVHGFAQVNHLYNPRLYAYGRGDGLHDGISGIDYQFTLSPGAGYYFLKSTNTLLSIETGPGLVEERLSNAGDTYMTLRLSQKFEHRFDSRVRIWESVEYLPEVDRWEKYLVNAELGVETIISKSFSLKTYLQDNYVNLPAAGRKDNDIKLVSGITYKF